MLLRSSSTPVLGSLLSSFSDSPSRDFDHHNTNPKHFSPIHDLGLKRNSISKSGQSSSGPFFFDSGRKPRSSSSSLGFRRAQSDGNLEGLIDAGFDSDREKLLRGGSNSVYTSMLETIPSFSIYNSVDEDECELGVDNGEDGVVDGDGSGDVGLERSVTIGESIGEVVGSGGGFSFVENLNLGLIKEDDEEGRSEPVSPPLYLARGLGIDSGFIGGGGGENGGNGGGYFNLVKFGDGGNEGHGMEEHYKRMVEENPGNPLFLRNYAQFLYQSKGDLHRAEEFYSRAILLDPGDGEVLSQYAKLIWELHHDHERASTYFERSVEVAPQDSHVIAAYASFLWETEDENEEDNLTPEPIGAPVLHGATGITSANA